MEKMRTIGYRLARITAALVVAVPAGLSMTTTAGAATCTATGFVRDGINLTAAQIGSTVSGTLDATGCDIGVYFAKPGSVTPGAQIFGARYFGVVNDGTSVTVAGASIHDIGNTPFDGTQNGIQVSRGAVAAVRGNSISDNFYTGEVGVGPNPGGQNPEGWEYFSTGLLLFEAGAGTKTADNQFSGNQHNFANVP